MDRPRIDTVDGRTLRKLPRPGPRHCIQRSLCPTVDGLSNKSLTAAYAREVDDTAAAISGEIWKCFLDEEEWSKDVGLVLAVPFLDGDFSDNIIVRDAGVVDDDVDYRAVVGDGVGESEGGVDDFL